MTVDPTHTALQDWVGEIAGLTLPDEIVWIDGSDSQRDKLRAMLVKQGVLTPLRGRFGGSFLACSDPRDVARVVKDTHICSEKNSGPHTNWRDPAKAMPEMCRRFTGAMRGRTMYVVPFSMGSLGGPPSKVVVQVTDSPYVVLNTLIMARTGQDALNELGTDGEFVRAVHSVGAPLAPGQVDVRWPCNPDDLKVCHFPDAHQGAGAVWSYGSGYGGNALLGKKCVALRLASAQAAKDPNGAMAEHMMLIRITETATDRNWHMAAAFPSACGKTNLAMLQPTIPGYKVTTIGDDIVWIRVGKDGRLYAINPEAGFFGVAPGTGPKTNPVATRAILKPGSLLTNVAYDPDTGEAWWPGLSDEPPARLIPWDWDGTEDGIWTRESGINPATTVHPNSRFTTPYAACETGDVAVWDDPGGVPLDLIVFGGRRSDTVPLARLADDWESGVLSGAMVGSARTAAAEGAVGEMTHDICAMDPFFGLSVGEYLANWLRIGDLVTAKFGADKLPKIAFVNWFLRDANGRFLWPGFGENGRVIDVLLRHLKGEVSFNPTPIGLIPSPQDFNLDGLDMSIADMERLLRFDDRAWEVEVDRNRAYLTGTFPDFPPALKRRLERMRQAIFDW